MKLLKSQLLNDRWSDQDAQNMSESELLLYRSNILGSDQRVTNYGGGNTSAKVIETDPLTGEGVEVLWVKGSGGDIGSIMMDGFATLYMDKLQALKTLYRGVKFEDEMVNYLPHCTFKLNPRAASIDTPLHAYVPRKHVDHVHADAIIAIAASKNSKALTQEIFGDRIGWLPWKRPGFELGLWLENFCIENPEADGVVLESHGLFTWDNTAKKCYGQTIDVINVAIKWLATHSDGVAPFGGPIHRSLPAQERHAIAAKLMPTIRGLISKNQHMVGHFNDAREVLEFVTSKDMEPLAKLGTSCPDHFLRTKICPLVVRFDPEKSNIDNVLVGLSNQIEAYRKNYLAYYERCKHKDSPRLRDPNAVVYLVPGVGMITFAKDKTTARISSEFYVNAINVMRDASAVSEYQGLPEQEAFDIEYWLLEEAKLQRMPKPKALAGRVALITGGGGGIGSATAERYLSEGACVVLADINEASLETTKEKLSAHFNQDCVHSIVMNVTSEDAVLTAFTTAALQYGGIDILVSNAGIASSAPIEDTSLELWNKNMDILSTGYFLVSREAFKLMRVQDLGGAVIFVASKNGLAASPNAAAYCTAKASEIHLARCLALEGAEAGIRVNTVNPDAVLRGSKIWEGDWLEQRASTYGTDKDGLEEMYRQRSMLKRSVLPEDIAEACFFFAADTSAKSTGNIINVDAGNLQAFTR
ncbi:MAG: bifunctional rhamnulose-1-phosphate aldolase/short-chain dehydrogenase [Tateyamaria sp.]|nr:bifunctional rhamnulose-1-phosphate aldolase/short-chain dehydrogenase [Tateyamaria sp.]MBT5302501.1 bifunctional rhamnulose-1-phosphate aldolase/short-chain dehydrogenase [Tateyamaria sp.]MBT6266209.1 bifunctional rhamnulose-1-phosphate aldolase/short-chain dehydrogenase [Tateyamaria sp.]MBT6343777.1 bifunctional rhamnulose-1-phosphate aldolase/short-chain dehydrogenase [Tateyamaria sp.]MBT7447363.1 bifunctional rhamnulose-1-phosphate aldolase/short-chain dehydrogenase [Tateyamaria sp.]